MDVVDQNRGPIEQARALVPHYDQLDVITQVDSLYIFQDLRRFHIGYQRWKRAESGIFQPISGSACTDERSDLLPNFLNR